MNDHPNHTVALSVVRHPYHAQSPVGLPPVFSIASLSIQRIGETEARFDTTHVTFEDNHDPLLPSAHVRALLRGDSHVVSCKSEGGAGGPWPNGPAPTNDEFGDPSPLPHGRCIHGIDHLPRLRRTTIDATPRILAAVARANGLHVEAEPVSMIQTARQAEHRAQVIWLCFLGFCGDGQAAAELYAAFRAWRAILDARPMPF